MKKKEEEEENHTFVFVRLPFSLYFAIFGVIFFRSSFQTVIGQYCFYSFCLFEEICAFTSCLLIVGGLHFVRSLRSLYIIKSKS